MNLDTENRGKVCLIRVSGRLDAESAPEFIKNFDRLFAKTKNFVIDATLMEFIDSTGLGKLVGCLKRLSEKGGNMKIANLQPKPKMVFEITKAYTVFDIFDDAEAAVESFH